MSFNEDDNPCAHCIKIIDEQAERLEFLETLLSDNCADPRLPFLEFSDNLEHGWQVYIKRFKESKKNT